MKLGLKTAFFITCFLIRFLGQNEQAFSTDKDSPKHQVFYEFDQPSDYYYPKQWGLKNDGSMTGSFSNIDIGMEKAWKLFDGGKREVIVAVIDTGVDIFHEDLEGAFWVNPGEVKENGVDDDGNGYIDDIHGWNFYENNNLLYSNEFDRHSTHVTGVIAANLNEIGISGIVGSSKVKIMVLKVLGGIEEAGYTYAIANAIRYAENNGASICNLSFGTALSDQNLNDAIAHSKMLFISAAGNGNKKGSGLNLDLHPIYPASYPFENIISVANLNVNGTLNPTSNFGVNTIHLAAPGSKILSTIDWKTYKNNLYSEPYGYMSGTSMATPMVTGVAAMLYSHFPYITLSEVREAILNGVKPLTTLEEKVKTGGILNIEGAFSYIHLHFSKKMKEREERVVTVANDGMEPKEKDLLSSKMEKGMKPKKIIKKGTAPKIQLKRIKKGRYGLSVTDKEKDLLSVKISEGIKKLVFFKKKKNGKKLDLIKTNKKGLSLKKGKTYTLYAVDKKGNQTIKYIKVKK